MTYEELLQQQAEAQESLARWRQTVAQCDEILRDVQIKRRNAELQISYYTGHAERLAIWIKRLEEQINDNP